MKIFSPCGDPKNVLTARTNNIYVFHKMHWQMGLFFSLLQIYMKITYLEHLLDFSKTTDKIKWTREHFVSNKIYKGLMSKHSQLKYKLIKQDALLHKIYVLLLKKSHTKQEKSNRKHNRNVEIYFLPLLLTIFFLFILIYKILRKIV